MKKRYSLLFMLTLVLAASALTCAVIFLTAGRRFGMFSENSVFLRDYASIMRRIERLYIGEYNPEELHNAAMNAAVDALDDRWSYYMSQEEYLEYTNYSTNSYAGIGIGAEVDEETGGMRILYVYRDSAADISGLVSGDIITAIDGEDITHMTLDEMTQLIHRELFTEIELTVIRESGEIQDVTVEYGYVFTNPVSYEMLDENVGYIILENFSQDSAASVIDAIETLLETGAQSFIYDVRNNGGGRVSELTALLDYLLPEGEIFVAVSKKGKEDIIHSDADMLDMPAAVLVNQYSYSAAEYFAATLGEYGYAYIVGEQTTGKNRSQVTFTLPSGGALHISSGEYLTKNRVSLFDTNGLTPEYRVALNDEQLELLLYGNLPVESDPQLNAALALLKVEIMR